MPLPSGASAVVQAFRDATDPDAGNPPKITTNVNPDGTYSLPNPTGAYTLWATYAFSGTNNNGTRSVAAPLPETASTNPVNFDIPTYLCTVIYAQESVGRLYATLADVRDIGTGDELTFGVNGFVLAPGDGTFPETPLVFQGTQNTDPLFNGAWGFVTSGKFQDKPIMV